MQRRKKEGMRDEPGRKWKGLEEAEERVRESGREENPDESCHRREFHSGCGRGQLCSKDVKELIFTQFHVWPLSTIDYMQPTRTETVLLGLCTLCVMVSVRGNDGGLSHVPGTGPYKC